MLTMCSVKCRALIDGLWLEDEVKQSAVRSPSYEADGTP